MLGEQYYRPTGAPRMKAAPAMAGVEAAYDPNEPAWRERAVSRSLNAARSRAEQRVQRFLDAAFELIDEKGSTEFTIQEVIDRSKQSLRGFYEYFDGKDELVLALFEETVREAGDDIRAIVDAETDPLARLRAFAIRLHEWCDPAEEPRKHGSHNRRAISEFSVHLTVNHADRVRAAIAPLSRLLRELVQNAADAGVIKVADTRLATALLQQSVMCSFYGNRLVENPEQRLTAEQTWEFCFHGLGG
jgi:AcrR family transcriptional regulator